MRLLAKVTKKFGPPLPPPLPPFHSTPRAQGGERGARLPYIHWTCHHLHCVCVCVCVCECVVCGDVCVCVCVRPPSFDYAARRLAALVVGLWASLIHDDG
jgi:hypothetical protein